jgi:RNA polymerase sigma factor (sigma-70 family)
MASESSVTTWLNRLKKDHDPDAVNVLWRRYFEDMLAAARKRLRQRIAIADEEDVALNAFDSFVRAAKQNRFPDLNDRDDLWRVLFMLVDRKAINLVKRERRKKRGGGRVVHASGLIADVDALDQFAGDTPTPEWSAAIGDEFQRSIAMLPDDLRRIAIWKMEGLTTAEIADKMSVSERTVKRHLALIRNLWQGILREE